MINTIVITWKINTGIPATQFFVSKILLIVFYQQVHTLPIQSGKELKRILIK